MLPVSGRISFLMMDHCKIRMGGSVPIQIDMGLADGNAEETVQETPIPIDRLACLMLGPGTSISQDAIKACADAGCLVLWTGEHGVRVYSAGQPSGASGAHILRQAGMILDPQKRLQAARRLYARMMGTEPPANRSIEQLRGLEGVWVRNRYAELAKLHQVDWRGRSQKFSDSANRAISMATSTLYGITEAAILALGYSPALGIVHTGDARSLVFDMADTVKFRTVVPLAFEIAAAHGNAKDLSGLVRRGCRDWFVKERLLDLLVDIIQEVIGAQEV
ncbi:type I-E CRISPR-associated endonuclease Cas1 [Acidithiobacillus thiooxidans]|uniref:CRISPR-associated endonuclease Cas1 n=1 Tax=Acidithiobacillus sulfurivorans TaxID=1958756 RepID=A0ABS5ZXF1_9PROT|nr:MULTISPECIES: type I-E CRISPR-associated endonuclease Cas1e [Acidithiobacillus]MBU2759710.1 type I-E CRISPR-associated endonuclease Cas1 [Acidithiobacillus sulfurivorans]MBU2792792.1 type I-E CRISPR-associated endonuclease Cas1 [Acidithiobacillus thiooxidans]